MLHVRCQAPRFQNRNLCPRPSWMPIANCCAHQTGRLLPQHTTFANLVSVNGETLPTKQPVFSTSRRPRLHTTRINVPLALRRNTSSRRRCSTCIHLSGGSERTLSPASRRREDNKHEFRSMWCRRRSQRNYRMPPVDTEPILDGECVDDAGLAQAPHTHTIASTIDTPPVAFGLPVAHPRLRPQMAKTCLGLSESPTSDPDANAHVGPRQPSNAVVVRPNAVSQVEVVRMFLLAIVQESASKQRKEAGSIQCWQQGPPLVIHIVFRGPQRYGTENNTQHHPAAFPAWLSCMVLAHMHNAVDLLSSVMPWPSEFPRATGLRPKSAASLLSALGFAARGIGSGEFH